MSNSPTWLDYLSTIGALATPLLVLALTGIGWTIRNRWEKTHCSKSGTAGFEMCQIVPSVRKWFAKPKSCAEGRSNDKASQNARDKGA